MRSLTLVLVLLGPTLAAQQQPPAGMTTYQVVLLKRGTAGGSPETMKGHMAHLERMERDGVLVGAGPIAGDYDIRGVLILKDVGVESAHALASADPAVKAGRFVPQVLPWWGPDN